MHYLGIEKCNTLGSSYQPNFSNQYVEKCHIFLINIQEAVKTKIPLQLVTS